MGIARILGLSALAVGLVLAAPLPGLAGALVKGDSEAFQAQRVELVREHLEKHDIADARVLQAMREVPRHLYVPEENRDRAHLNQPLPIGYGQTISQPHIVAYMCEKVGIKPTDRILEIGTGSGYHASVLSRLGKSVHSIEIVPQLAERAAQTIKAVGYDNITTKQGDGYFGWADAGPFDVIVVTAVAEHIPPPLLNQLAEGGRMVIPVGQPFLTQVLVLAEKKDGKVHSRELKPVAFVPLTRGK